MRRIIIVVAIVLYSFAVFGITQKGYVRTIMRPGSNPQRLQGVVIRVKGEHNSVMSDDAGNFTILFDQMQNGDAYSLLAVIKSGYELREKEMIGRVMPCSDKVSFEILMVSREELARERMAIEKKARENLERSYLEKLSQLDEQLAQNKIQEQEYMRLLEEANEKYEKYEPLLNAMADKYARTDYANMDSITMDINQAIENGNIDEAQRLIQAKGNMEERESKILERRQQEEQAAAMLKKAADKLESARQETMKVLTDLADDYYHMYSIHLTKFNNDSARYYIIKRAELDTANVEYQLQAAQYLMIFTMEYNLAIQYDERAMRNSMKRNGKIYGDVATAYNDIATAYTNMRKYDDAERNLNEAMAIRLELHGEKDKSMAESYNNLGRIYYETGKIKEAEKYFQKSISIRASLEGKDNQYEKAKSELNLASVYVKQNKYDKAIELFTKILVVLIDHDGETSMEVANCHNNMGAAYYYAGNYAESIKCFEKAYAIFKQVKGENHNQTVVTRNNLNAVRAINGEGKGD